MFKFGKRFQNILTVQAVLLANDIGNSTFSFQQININVLELFVTVHFIISRLPSMMDGCHSVSNWRIFFFLSARWEKATNEAWSCWTLKFNRSGPKMIKPLFANIVRLFVEFATWIGIGPYDCAVATLGACRTIFLRLQLGNNASYMSLALLVVPATNHLVFCGTAKNFAAQNSVVLLLLFSWSFLSLLMSDLVCRTSSTSRSENVGYFKNMRLREAG